MIRFAALAPYAVLMLWSGVAHAATSLTVSASVDGPPSCDGATARVALAVEARSTGASAGATVALSLDGGRSFQDVAAIDANDWVLTAARDRVAVVDFQLTVPSSGATSVAVLVTQRGGSGNELKRARVDLSVAPSCRKDYEVDELAEALLAAGAYDVSIVAAPETGTEAVLFTMPSYTYELPLAVVCRDFSGAWPSIWGGAFPVASYSGICFPAPRGLDETWADVLDVPTSVCASGRADVAGRLYSWTLSRNLTATCR